MSDTVRDTVAFVPLVGNSDLGTESYGNIDYNRSSIIPALGGLMDEMIDSASEPVAGSYEPSELRCAIDFLEGRHLELLHEEIIGESTNAEFLKSSKLSPDGSQIATASETNFIATWKISGQILADKTYYDFGPGQSICSDISKESLSVINAIDIGESLYDFAWYPGMNSAVPSTCCIIATSRDHPLQVTVLCIF
jgi:hypothetical protein